MLSPFGNFLSSPVWGMVQNPSGIVVLSVKMGILIWWQIPVYITVHRIAVCWKVWRNVFQIKKTLKKLSTTPSCSGPIPAQKIRGNLVPGPRAVFFHTIPKMDFYYFHPFSWEKHTKLIYHMPWLYQYPPLPFHRSYKN